MVKANKWEKHKPSFIDGNAISTGAKGGYHGDFSILAHRRCLCHLSPKTCSVVLTSGCYQQSMSKEMFDFGKWLLPFLSPPPAKTQDPGI